MIGRIMLAGGPRWARPTSRPSSSTTVPLAPGPDRWSTSPSQRHLSMPPGKASLRPASIAGRISSIDDLVVTTSMVRSLMGPEPYHSRTAPQPVSRSGSWVGLPRPPFGRGAQAPGAYDFGPSPKGRPRETDPRPGSGSGSVREGTLATKPTHYPVAA